MNPSKVTTTKTANGIESGLVPLSLNNVLQADLVSPYLEEIFQAMDDTLCFEHRKFDNLTRNSRIIGALAALSTVGLAEKMERWELSREARRKYSVDLKKVGIPCLKIEYASEEPYLLDELSSEYARAFEELVVQSEPLLRKVFAAFRNFYLGFLKWNRQPDGQLKWVVTKRGIKFLKKSEADRVGEFSESWFRQIEQTNKGQAH